MAKASGEQHASPVRWLAPSGLRGRLLLLIAFVLLPAFGLILYTFAEQRTAAADRARGDALWLIRLVAAEHRALMESAQQQLLGLAQLPFVTHRNQAALCNRSFAGMLRHQPHYANLGVIDPDGNLRCSALPFGAPVNLADREYFRRAVQTRGIVIGDYQVGRVTGKSGINVAYPLFDSAGTLTGVVFVALDMASWLARVIAKTPLPEGSTLTVLDPRGTMLARHPDPDRWVGKTLPSVPLVQAILTHNGEGTTESRGVDGVERLYVYTPFAFSPDNKVYISAGIPTAVAYADVDRMLARSLVLLAIIATVVLLAVRWGSHILVLRPAAALIEAARKFGGGDLGARTGMSHAGGEFGRLAQTFDEMATALEARDRRLHAVEDERRLADARFADILRNAPDAVISIDTDQKILLFNRGAEAIFGYRPDEVVGRSLAMLLPARHAASHGGQVRRFAAGNELSREMGAQRDIQGRRKDGGEFPAVVTISKLEHNGETVMTAILRDITERKRAEDEIRRLNADLERRVRERTAQLTAANRELEAFSYSVSHDLRAPLRAIDGFSQALVEDYAGRLDDQADDYLQRVRAATQRMGQLIDDLLRLSRVTRAEMRHVPVDLSTLAAEIVAELRKSAPQRTVETVIAPGLTTRGDPALLRVMLENLLGNAWKFTGRTEGARIEFAATRGDNGEPLFRVRDNGAGFDMTYVDKLFGTFQRLHSPDEFPGTGIGLATVQRVVHRHGGHIHAEGAPGGGATFTFTLPEDSQYGNEQQQQQEDQETDNGRREVYPAG